MKLLLGAWVFLCLLAWGSCSNKEGWEYWSSAEGIDTTLNAIGDGIELVTLWNDYREERITKKQFLLEMAVLVGPIAGRAIGSEGIDTVFNFINAGIQFYSFTSKAAAFLDDYREERISNKKILRETAAWVGPIAGRVIGGTVGFTVGGPVGSVVGTRLGRWIGGAVAKAVSTN